MPDTSASHPKRRRLESMISVRFSPEEIEMLDKARGPMSRSSWLRRAVDRAVAGRPRPSYDPLLNVGVSTGGVQYTKYEVYTQEVGQIRCGRERGHDGVHEGHGYRWSA